MTFNGQDMADSQLCMEHLARTLGKDLSQNLTAEQRAVARAMRAVLEDNLYFCAAMDRCINRMRERIECYYSYLEITLLWSVLRQIINA
jgi:hypothetical protein